MDTILGISYSVRSISEALLSSENFLFTSSVKYSNICLGDNTLSFDDDVLSKPSVGLRSTHRVQNG
jgi:hypothetical protein